MQELRFVAVSEDGRYAVLAIPGRSARFMLPIDERLRAVALGQTSRLAQYEIEVESPLRPKEIQARIRAGETVEEIADAAGIAVERVRWFEAPVLAERAYVADQAQSASVRRHGDSTPGPRLGEVVQPTLLIHSRRDHTCPYDRNVNLVMRHLGSVDKRALALEESYHVITVDSEKDRVAQETLDFIAPFRTPARLTANG